jgi:DNA topoisomerase III
MKVILTEKPSVARDIAKVFPNAKANDGYIDCGSGYFITWAFGHLIEIAKSNAPHRWDLNNLPILPGEFYYEVTKDKTTQFKIIKSLLTKADGVIIATDSGREGELIARLILKQADWTRWNETKRFWSSQALSEEVIKHELKNLKFSSHYDSLFYSALARQQSDWLCGINLTQLFTLRSGSGTWSVGRVQTPTLALIVNRDKLRNDFQKEEYYSVKAQFEAKEGKYSGLLKFGDTGANQSQGTKEGESEDGIPKNPDKLLKKEQAEKILSEIVNEKQGVIKTLKKEDKQEAPPLLHSLTSLQREANSVHGFSASKTLSVAQGLYETQKVISYPRTESQHLGESSMQLARDVLKKLNKDKLIPEVDNVGKRVFDDSKLTDHHALIPLMPPNDRLSPDEVKVYILIARKFTGAFMPLYKYEKTTITTTLKEYEFITSGIVVTQPGWKGLYTEEKKNDGPLPQVTEKEKVTHLKSELEQKFTQPPAAFNESTLLKKMESLSMGTPATRASIIEKLLERQYIVREKRNLLATDKGKELIRILKDSPISSPEMTGEWEQKLEKIYKDKLSLPGYENFISAIKIFVSDQIVQYKSVSVSRINMATPNMLALANKYAKERKLTLESQNFEYIKQFIDTALKTPVVIGKCGCGKEIKASPKAYNCECGKVIWKELAGKKITAKQAESLMKGNKVLIKGFKKKDGNKFNATIVLDTANKIQFLPS